jgi:hypothetical protein
MEEAHAKWQDMQAGFARLGMTPAAVLRPLDDMDGDFEMQKPASGGSNGVLVPPWFYQGEVAVTAAQSPFRHLHPFGNVAASVAGGTGHYSIRQTFLPTHTGGIVQVNLEFRVANDHEAAKGSHRFALGPRAGSPPSRR